MTIDRRSGAYRGVMGSGQKEELVRAARAVGVDDPHVLEAMRAVPRVAFVPQEHAERADTDVPVPIPHHQVTTQPSLSARMVQALHLTGHEHVLEVGTGYGYQTALIAHLVRSVISVERRPDLADQARRNLAGQRIGNVEVIVGDGTEGVPEHAPYDAILVSAAFPRVPPPLVEQLRVGGRLVQPIGPGGADEVVSFDRTAEGLTRRELVTLACFVRLYGHHGYG
jgi:protein-L-isoaspartate(D-aspartate) O-methyltransferase